MSKSPWHHVWQMSPLLGFLLFLHLFCFPFWWWTRSKSGCRSKRDLGSLGFVAQEALLLMLPPADMVGFFSHYLQGFIHVGWWWSPDFWTINSSKNNQPTLTNQVIYRIYWYSSCFRISGNKKVWHVKSPQSFAYYIYQLIKDSFHFHCPFSKLLTGPALKFPSRISGSSRAKT